MLRSRLSCHASAFSPLRAIRINLAPAALIRPALQTLPSPTLPSAATHSFATKSKRRAQKNSQHGASSSAPRVPQYVETLVQLRDAIADRDVKSILAAYLTIRGSLRLGGDDVASMAHALHAALRTFSKSAKDQPPPAEVTALADLLVADIGAHHLPPNHTAHCSLLVLYKDARQFEKGAHFWEWLETQDDSFVNPAVYGAAVELLAVQGRPGEETERLYDQALKRFPGSFAEYHLSPDAIVPDRSRYFDVKGIPVALLHAITTARLLRGDTHSAYLALDTALRLFPTQLPARLVTLFVNERPVTEAYKVFLMACRSGIIPGPDALKALLVRLRRVAVKDPLANASVLRSLLTASYAYAAIGASLSPSHLSEIVIAITSIIQHPTTAHLSKPDANQLADHILLPIANLFAIWKRQGSLPGIAAFNSIIANLAGKGHGDKIIALCLADMNALGIQPTLVTRHSLLKAAAQMGQPDLLVSTWHDLVAFRQASARSVALSDWGALVTAAKTMGKEDFVRQQLDQLGTSLNPFLVSKVHGLIDQEKDEETPRDHVHVHVTADQVRQLIDDFLRDTAYMDEELQALQPRNFHTDPLPMSLASPGHFGDAADPQLRALYDELTSDNSPKQMEYRNDLDEKVSEEELLVPEALVQPKPAISSTGLEYNELRYQNWKTINELLAESAQSDASYMAAVDAAIQNGTPPPSRGYGWKNPDTITPSWGLSNLEAYQEIANSDGHDGNIREKVLRLRGKLDRV